MPTESEKLAQSAKAMSLVEEYFPAAANIEYVIDVCKKLGLDEYYTKTILKEGGSYVCTPFLTDPATGEKHLVVECHFSVDKDGEGNQVIHIDNKSIPDFFSFLNKREKTLKAAADKDGIAGEIYRENLQLKREITNLKEQNERLDGMVRVLMKKIDGELKA